MPTVTKLQYLMSWEWEWSESWFLLILLCSLATQEFNKQRDKRDNLGWSPSKSQECAAWRQWATCRWSDDCMKSWNKKGNNSRWLQRGRNHHKMATEEGRFSQFLTQKFFVYVRLLSQQQGELEEQQQRKDNLEHPTYFWHCPLQTKCKYII